MTTLLDLLPCPPAPTFRTSCGVPNRDEAGHCDVPRHSVVSIDYQDAAGVWQPKCWQPTCLPHLPGVVARLADLAQHGWLGTQTTRIRVAS